MTFMQNKLYILFITLFAYNASLRIFAQQPNFNIHGQLSGWLSVKPQHPFSAQTGGRYIPTLAGKINLNDKLKLDAEISPNVYGSLFFHSGQPVEDNGAIQLYRAWLRLSANQFELRLGLQKINFGSATLLRPMMWFDQVDPRDPLQLTTGVYGLLFRYYFLNNANMWLWGLMGNDNPKGWELIGSDRKKPEFGGRFQFPLSSGEIAISYHHREANTLNTTIPLIDSLHEIVPEDRIGLDGKWDLGIGLWFESSLSRMPFKLIPDRYTRMGDMGMDYTFGIGNGLHVLGEQFIYSSSKKAFDKGENITLTALLANYPIGLIHNISAIVYYDWTNNGWYRFINWQMTYDKWSFYLMGFWNPDQFQLYQTTYDTSMFTGAGFQVMVVFNH
jgi:hypothetical protein